MSLYLCVALTCFLGGALSGMAGFGALLIMVPALIFVLGAGVTIPFGVLCGIATQSFNAYCCRKHIKNKILIHMLPGSLPGIWLGGALGRRMTLRMPAEQYMRLIFTILFIMGLSLCWPAFDLYILHL